MKLCRETVAALPKLLSGLCPPAERDAIEAHLLLCEKCASERDALASIVDGLGHPYPGEEETDWNGFSRRVITRAVLAEQEPQRQDSRDVGSLPGEQRGVILPFRRYRPGGLFASRGVRAAGAVAGAGAILLAVLGTGHLLQERLGSAGGDSSGRARVPTEEQRAGPHEDGPGSADLISAVDAIAVRGQVVAALTEGRDLLSSLTAPIACDDHGVSLTIERSASRSLLRRTQFLDARLVGTEAERAASVWRDLRDLLREMDAIPECARREQIETFRTNLARSGLLTRLDVVIWQLGPTGGGERSIDA